MRSLPDPWLAFGVDSFVDAMPAMMRASTEGLEITDGAFIGARAASDGTGGLAVLLAA